MMDAESEGKSVSEGSQATGPVQKKRGWVRAFRIALWSFGLLGLSTLLLLVFLFHRFSQDLPSIEELKVGYHPPQVTRILARDGTLLGSIYLEKRTVVPFERVPDHVKSAFLAAEDAHFYEHEGLNYFGLLRAVLVNLRAGRLRQGGSTITQQVVKNVLLDSERSYRRKIKETILSFRLEKELTKDQILAMYLNHIYLGHGRYGVEEAARFLFGKHIEQLDVAEGALLAGIVASPENYSPRKNQELALRRRHYVLSQMLDKGFMTAEVHAAAQKQPIVLSPAVESESDIAPEAVEEGRKTLALSLGRQADTGGYSVVTSIDPALQVAARKAVRDGLDAYAKRLKLAPPFTLAERKLWPETKPKALRQHGIYLGKVVKLDDVAGTVDLDVHGVIGRVRLSREERYNPTHLSPSGFCTLGAALRVRLLDDPKEGTPESPVRLRLELGPQAALVALDVATGEVLAQVGSYEALPGGLDRSSQVKRQPGSAFKPILYAAALAEKSITLGQVFRFTKEGEAGASPDPEERISLRQGVARSDNRVAEAVIEQIGAERTRGFAELLGIRSQLGATKSLALGAYEVGVLELASAYSVFARGGRLIEPRLVREIESGAGKIPLPPIPPERPVLDPEVAYLTTVLLEGVIQSGTAVRAKSLGRSLAGKTGTTNRAKDAWFVGFSPEIVVAVWVGYDDALPLGVSESGASAALPIWIDFMRAAEGKKPKIEFSRPPGLLEVSIDPATGWLARPGQEDAILELYLPGTEPQEVAPEPGVVESEGAPDRAPSIDGGESTGTLGEAPAADPPGAPSLNPPPPEPQPELSPELPPF